MRSPETDSHRPRGVRVAVARGSIEYSAETQPFPARAKRRDAVSMEAVHSTRVSPIAISTSIRVLCTRLKLTDSVDRERGHPSFIAHMSPLYGFARLKRTARIALRPGGTGGRSGHKLFDGGHRWRRAIARLKGSKLFPRPRPKHEEAFPL